MSKSAAVSLIASGQLTRSWFARLLIARRSSSPDWLGAVYAPSLRLASRTANILRAGTPTTSLAKALEAGLLIVRVPEDELDGLLGRVEKADAAWRGKVVAVCDSKQDTARLRTLERRGAFVATLNAHDFNTGVRFVVEGDNRAVGALHRYLNVPRVGTLRIEKGKKSRYFRSLEIIDYVLPLAIAAEKELREAGVDRESASVLIEERVDTVTRYYRRAGRKGWKIDWASALERMNERLAAGAER